MKLADASVVEAAVACALKEAQASLNQTSALTPKEVKAEVQARMSDYAGIICKGDEVKQALAAARKLRQRIQTEGLRVSSPSLVGQVFRWRHMALVSEAVLTALDYYISHGGGSRGARAICSEDGTEVPEAHKVDLSRFRFVVEQEKDRHEKLVARLRNDTIEIHVEPVDLKPEVQREFFEKGWGSYLVKEG
jgi:succinate dehydrogenase/fumarate reductase flavoprotein subunit